MAAQEPGDPIRLAIASGGAEREVAIPLGHKKERSYHMKAIVNRKLLQAKTLQGRIRQE